MDKSNKVVIYHPMHPPPPQEFLDELEDYELLQDPDCPRGMVFVIDRAVIQDYLARKHSRDNGGL